MCLSMCLFACVGSGMYMFIIAYVDTDITDCRLAYLFPYVYFVCSLWGIPKA